MKLHQVINGYKIITKPATTKDQTAFAVKNGRYFFIKMFIDPKFPQAGGPGSEVVRQAKLAQCAEFEQRNAFLNARISPASLGAGNLVLANEIFREGSTYYKVSEVVVPSVHRDITALNPHQALVVLRTVVLSIRLLHQAGFIHGDLKPDNVIVQETRPGVFVGKVIDFDDGYIAGSPPSPAEVIGDTAYYSPELMLYVKESPQVTKADLTIASDMFSLGLLIHFLLTAQLPDFDRERYKFAAAAAISGDLRVSLLTGPLQAWVSRLMDVDYRNRPLVDDLLYFLLDISPQDFATWLPDARAITSSRPSGHAGLATDRATPTLKGTLKKA